MTYVIAGSFDAHGVALVKERMKDPGIVISFNFSTILARDSPAKGRRELKTRLSFSLLASTGKGISGVELHQRIPDPKSEILNSSLYDRLLTIR
jgi:hypothetical protein